MNFPFYQIILLATKKARPTIFLSFLTLVVQPYIPQQVNKGTDLYSLLLKSNETLLPKRTWLQALPQRMNQSYHLSTTMPAEISGAWVHFLSLKGVIYALWRIFNCITMNLTDLEITAGSLHILSHSAEVNKTPKSSVWMLRFEEVWISILYRPETVLVWC